MNNKTTAKTNYFNLHTKGIGYLSNIHKVDVKKGQPYLSCTLSAISGSSDDLQFTFFNCNVTGEKANMLVQKCINASNNRQKILICFTLSDLYVDLFTYAKGEKKGQTGCSLKARLINISSIKIDGVLKYSDSQTTTVANVQTATIANVPTATIANAPTATEANVPTATIANVPTATIANVPTATIANVPTATEKPVIETQVAQF